MNDKEIEYYRYNRRSETELSRPGSVSELNGYLAMPYLLQSPFLYYESLLCANVKPGTLVLDVCCGDGVHSLKAAQCGGVVTVTDIAEKSLEIAALRAKRAGLHAMKFVVADAENLPFENSSFEVITCVGSLSYVDLKIFTSEILRVLKPGGVFIALDSFDHNPIYRLNRFVHFLKGNRSFSTLKRMPNSKTVGYLRSNFTTFEINYFGIFSFMGGLLKYIVGEERAKNLIDSWDRRFSIMKRQAFKIVLLAVKG